MFTDILYCHSAVHLSCSSFIRHKKSRHPVRTSDLIYSLPQSSLLSFITSYLICITSFHQRVCGFTYINNTHTHTHLNFIHCFHIVSSIAPKICRRLFHFIFVPRPCSGTAVALYPFTVRVCFLPLGGSDHLLCLLRSRLQNLQKENERVFPYR